MSRTLASLDAEWARLARSSAARAALCRWSTLEPALSGPETLDDLLALRRDPARCDSLLRALARLAPDDVLAARTLLQAMLPGLVRIAVKSRDGDDAVDDVLAAAWERIRTYPPQRAGSVAANIVCDVRKRYLQHRALERVQQELPAADGVVRSPEELVVELDLVRQLVWAKRQGLITADEFRVIVRTRVQGDPPKVVAAEERLPVGCVLKRRWRGERALRTTLAVAG